MRKYEDILKLVVKFLNESKIPYMVVGAVSVAIWGTPRTSKDIDIIIMLEGNIEKFANFLNKNNFSTSIEDIKAALKERSHFTVFDNLSMYRLDVKGIYSKFDRKSFARRRKKTIHKIKIWVNSPEDAILSKLVFGSEQDLNDVRSIILVQKKLDMHYLQKGAKELGVYGTLKKLLKEIRERS